MYHKIGKRPPGAVINGHYVAEALLVKQLRVLKSLGYTGATFKSVIKGETNGKVAAITFDDGYQNFPQLAVPILQRFSFKATVFVVTGFMGDENKWDTNWGEAREPLMSWAEAKECQKWGMEVGSHSVHHLRLGEINPVDAKKEIDDSMTHLNTNLGDSDWTFCYPFGSHSATAVEAVKQAGYIGATSVKKGYMDGTTDKWLVPRINVRADTVPAILAYKIFRALVLKR